MDYEVYLFYRFTYNAKKVELEAWYDSVRTELDKIRAGQNHWYAEDHLSKTELDAVKKYASSMLDFTNAQNSGLTGIGLYSFNEVRANAHEEMLEVFGLENNELALHVTKSYDFSADYDYKMSMYKLIPEDIVVNMLGFALVGCMNNKREN